MTHNGFEFDIDYAQPKDIGTLYGLHGNLVGVKYEWRNRLGKGSDLYTPLALVARKRQKVVGYLGWGPFTLTRPVPGGGIVPLTPGPSVPWTKLHALGVSEKHRAEGIAQALLDAAIAHLPEESFGVFGDVSPEHITALKWYRARGFHISRGHALTNPVEPANVTLIEPADGTFHFLAERDQLHRYRGRSRTPDEEKADAFNSVEVVERITSDETYRAFAHQLIVQSRGCEHMALCAQTGYLHAWDPEKIVCCLFCKIERMNVLRGTTGDSETHCDRCDVEHPKVESRTAFVGLIYVGMGLCPTCRRSPAERAAQNPQPKKRWIRFRRAQR